MVRALGAPIWAVGLCLASHSAHSFILSLSLLWLVVLLCDAKVLRSCGLWASRASPRYPPSLSGGWRLESMLLALIADVDNRTH